MERALKVLAVVGMVILLPIISFLCVKWGTFGFYRGKELNKREPKEE